LNASGGRAKFVRQLYNLRHVLETDKEPEHADAEIQRLQNNIEQHKKGHPMKSFYTKGNVLTMIEAQVEVEVLEA
jgi:hypothetical protein